MYFRSVEEALSPLDRFSAECGGRGWCGPNSVSAELNRLKIQSTGADVVKATCNKLTEKKGEIAENTSWLLDIDRPNTRHKSSSNSGIVAVEAYIKRRRKPTMDAQTWFTDLEFAAIAEVHGKPVFTLVEQDSRWRWIKFIGLRTENLSDSVGRTVARLSIAMTHPAAMPGPDDIAIINYSNSHYTQAMLVPKDASSRRAQGETHPLPGPPEGCAALGASDSNKVASPKGSSVAGTTAQWETDTAPEAKNSDVVPKDASSRCAQGETHPLPGSPEGCAALGASDSNQVAAPEGSSKAGRAASQAASKAALPAKKAAKKALQEAAKEAETAEGTGGGFVTLGDRHVAKGTQRTCLPDAALNCLRELGDDWDHKAVIDMVMPRNGKDPTIGDVTSAELVEKKVHFKIIPRFRNQMNPEQKAVHLLQLARCPDVVLVQAMVKPTPEALENGMASKKERHCFVVSCGHRDARKPGLVGAIIDNRSANPKAMIEPADRKSPADAKWALDRFFGGANVVIQNAWVATLAGPHSPAKQAAVARPAGAPAAKQARLL